jgi:polysaccharide export outer membrane protein
MFRTINGLIVFLLIVPLLFVGCASTGGKVADTPAENVQAPAQPKVSEYLFGIGDSLDISIYRNEDLKTSTKISPSGTIMFPLIGEVQAAGKSISTLRDELKERFSKYLVDPQITISVTAIQSSKVVVLGEVRTPGVYTLDTELTIIDAVAKAGGWTADAKMSNIILLRNVSGKVETRSLDMEAALAGGSLSQNKPLQRNDIVYVPTKKIADIARFMTYIGSILSPIVLTEAGVVLWPNVIKTLEGKSSSTSLSLPSK